MRGDVPQEFRDFVRMQRISAAGAWDTSQAYYVGDGGLGPWDMTPSSSSKVGVARAAIFQRYCTLVGATPPSPVTSTPTSHTPATESSECLYLMLTAAGSEEGMKFSIDQVPTRFIKDTDNDGLMEFVDAWGTPLQFYRWPTDYLAYLIEYQQSFQNTSPGSLDPKRYLTNTTWFGSAAKRQTSFELSGYYRLHPAYPAPVAPSTTPDVSDAGLNTTSGVYTSRVNDVALYPLTPMILSAGPDKEFGIRINPTPGAAYSVGNVPLLYRAGHVDPANQDKVLDNISNLEITAGRN
jgi:hypothetical protein